jgi:DNA modification methylase
MELIKKKVKDLIPYINNSRTHSEEQITQLVSSIKEFGFTNPILLAPDNSIIAGHGRLQAVKRLGHEEVPCIIVEGLTKTQIKALIIADNQLALNAGWDLEKLSVEIEGLEADKFDLNILGFEDEFLKDLLHKENLGLTDEDSIPEVKENPKSKLGDIFILGNHKIICEDSFNENIVIKFIENTDKKFTFTDPPYELTTKGGGILKESNSMKQIQNNNVNKFEPSNLKLYSKTNIYFHNKPLIKKYIELAENNNKSFDLCFYKKENVAPNYAGHMMTDVEYISIIGDQSPNKGLDKSLYSKLYIGKKDNDNKLSYSKPVELCEKYIKLYAKNHVIDLFLGSGSTLIACEKLNKICYGFEHNPQFIDVIIQRWQQFTGKEAIHEQTGKTYNSI